MTTSPHKNKRILIAPLNWGLGHATRCIPIIAELVAQGATPVLAAKNEVRAVVQSAFTDIETIDDTLLDDWQINYPKNGNMLGAMLLQLPKFNKIIEKEHQQLQHIIKICDIQGVISDNRYGLHTSQVPCVLVTHQLRPQSPAFLLGMGEGLIQKIIENFAKKFTKVWLPDQPTAPLAGRLVQHSKLKNTAFVGALSRFCGNLDAEYPKDIDILVLLSGLEPQRTLLENIIITQVNDDFFSTQKVVLVRGLPLLNATPAPHKNLWQIHNYLPQIPLESLIKRSKLVVCRSGYSTIMDLATAQSKAAFVPTPGQTEQVYLSAHLQKSGVAPYHHQHNFDFKKLIYQSEKYSGFADKYTENCDYLLKTQVTSLLASIY